MLKRGQTTGNLKSIIPYPNTRWTRRNHRLIHQPNRSLHIPLHYPLSILPLDSPTIRISILFVLVIPHTHPLHPLHLHLLHIYCTTPHNSTLHSLHHHPLRHARTLHRISLISTVSSSSAFLSCIPNYNTFTMLYYRQICFVVPYTLVIIMAVHPEQCSDGLSLMRARVSRTLPPFRSTDEKWKEIVRSHSTGWGGGKFNTYTFESRPGVTRYHRVIRVLKGMRCVPFVDAVHIFPTLWAEALREHLSPQLQRKYHHEIRCGGLTTASEEASFALTEPRLKLVTERGIRERAAVGALTYLREARTYSLWVSKRGAIIRHLTASKTLHSSGLRRRGAFSGTLLQITPLKRIGMRVPSA